MTSAAFLHGVGSHAAAFGVLLLQACLGARALRLARMDEVLSTHERLLFGWAVGFALTTAAWMGLSGLGLLAGASVAVVALVTAIAAWPEARLLGEKTWRVVRTADPGTRLAAGVGLVVLAFWAWPFWVETLLPNSDWDSALYHLPLAERYASGALWGRDPYFPAFAFPGAVHLLYAALLAIGLESAITPLAFQVTLLTLVTSIVLARQTGGRRAPIWAALAFATTPILWQLGLDARIDGFLAFEIALAVYALVRFAQQGRDPHLVFAAFALGAAIGTKYTAWPFVVAVGALGLGLRVWAGRGTRGLVRLVAGCTLALALPNAGWYVANLAIHGDPFFPILRGDYVLDARGEARHLHRADEPLDPALLADPAVQARLRVIERTPHAEAPDHLFDFVDLLLRPERYAVRPSHGMGPLLLLSLALPLALPVLPERRRAAILLWLLGWGSYGLLGSQTGLLRYAAPSLPLLAAATGVLIARIPWRAVHLAIGLAALLLLARDHESEQRKLALLKPRLVLDGEASPWSDATLRTRWLEQVGFNFTPPMAFVADEMSQRVASGAIPASCRVFMVGEGKGRLLPCDFLPDSSWFGHRFVAELLAAELDPDRVAASLHAQGVTHLLYNRAYYDWVLTDTDTSRERIAFLLAHLERFLDAHAEPVLDVGGIGVYELRSGARRQ